jgi:hypothetical protein
MVITNLFTATTLQARKIALKDVPNQSLYQLYWIAVHQFLDELQRDVGRVRNRAAMKRIFAVREQQYGNRFLKYSD